ncbi:DnaD domain protein [Limosilactobacillus fermentum]|uniref:DnaD domain-containing protein n=1 Tax=Limosilactobacillus fermentum TaxID=1613 RepID=UPI0033622E2A
MAENQFLMTMLEAGSTNVSNLLLHHYHDIDMTTGELMVYLELKSYIDRGNPTPDLELVADHLGTSSKQVFELVHQMTKKNLVEQRLRRQPDGKEDAYYDFTPLYDRLARAVNYERVVNEQKQADLSRSELFNQIQVEFGRTISPMEMQTVNQWLDEDHYQLDLVQLALKEAVLAGKYNLKYIEGILRRWRQSRLTTPQQVMADKHQYELAREQRGEGRPGSTSDKPLVLKASLKKLHPDQTE